jgi:hypothetical protein
MRKLRIHTLKITCAQNEPMGNATGEKGTVAGRCGRESPHAYKLTGREAQRSRRDRGGFISRLRQLLGWNRPDFAVRRDFCLVNYEAAFRG